MFYFNARDIQKQSPKDVEAASHRCFQIFIPKKFHNIHSQIQAAGLKLRIL